MPRSAYPRRRQESKAIKLLSVAGAYWKGDASGRQLQRLYGTAFFDKKDLAAFFGTARGSPAPRSPGAWANSTACSRSIPKLVQGLPLWLPRGARVRVTLEDFLRRELLTRGYDPVYSPHIGRVELYETSGHFPYYRDSQFSPIFGEQAGGLIDAWSSRLAEGTLDSDDGEIQADGRRRGARRHAAIV